MRFPLSMTVGIAGYIARNKMRPRPEWQLTRAAPVDDSNPFPVLHPAGRRSGSPHPMIRFLGKRGLFY